MFKFIIVLFLTLFSTQTVLAQTEPLNAGLIPYVWYSSPTIAEDDTVTIYSGVYNQSTTTISATASIYIDNTKVDDISITSEPNTLKEISGSWKAIGGKHSVKLTLDASSHIVSSKETGIYSLEVKRNTGSHIKKEASGIIEETRTKIDAYTQGLVEKLQKMSSKPEDLPHVTINGEERPAELRDNSLIEEAQALIKREEGASLGEVGKVLGAQTKNIAKKTAQSPVESVKNFGIGIAVFLLTHWIWVLATLILLVVIKKVVRR